MPKDWELLSVPYKDVAYNPTAGRLVAVGDGGLVFVSDDGGQTWNRHSVGADVSLNGVAFGNGRFVAVGQGDYLYESSDGESWTAIKLPQTGLYLYAVAYGSGEFLAVGYHGAYVTYDPATEDMDISTESSAFTFYDVAFGNGFFVAGGRDYDNGEIALFTYDPNNGNWSEWKTGETGYVSTFPVVYDGNQFLALTRSYSYTSSDGSSWTKHQVSNVPSDPTLAYGNGTFLAAGCCGRTAVSSNGQSWTRKTVYVKDDPQVQAGSFYGATFVGDHFVVVGSGGLVATTSDGQSWSVARPGTGQYTRALAFDGRRFLLGDDSGGVFTSTDGASWQPLSELDHFITGFAYDRTAYVAIGYHYIDTSSDAVSWSQAANFDDGSGNNKYANALAHGGNRFVVVGQSGIVMTSNDHGSSWKNEDSGTTEDLTGVAYGNGRFVAVGKSGTIVVRESDGSWRASSSGTGNDLAGVAFGNGRFVAVGEDATLLYADDPTGTWKSVSIDNSGWFQFKAVTYGEGGFVAVADTGNGPVVYYSLDGEQWENVSLPDGIAAPERVAFGNGVYLALGMDGTVLRAQ